MLIFGDYTCIPRDDELTLLNKTGLTVFNFSSYVQNCIQLTNLLPKSGVDCSSEENFDMSYFDYIFNTDFAFIDFMYLVYALYKGDNVYVIIQHTEFFDKLAESLAELIKQRYGYISFFINEYDDYESINIIDNDNGDFSIVGLGNLDIDKVRFVSLLQNYNIIKDNPEDYS